MSAEGALAGLAGLSILGITGINLLLLFVVILVGSVWGFWLGRKHSNTQAVVGVVLGWLYVVWEKFLKNRFNRYV